MEFDPQKFGTIHGMPMAEEQTVVLSIGLGRPWVQAGSHSYLGFLSLSEAKMYTYTLNIPDFTDDNFVAVFLYILFPLLSGAG